MDFIKNFNFEHTRSSIYAVVITLMLPASLNAVSAKEIPTFMGGFETGDDYQWDQFHYNEQFDKNRQFSVVTSPVRHGKYAAKLTVNDGDVFRQTGGERADFLRSGLHDEKEGDEYWYAWSTFFPSDWQAPKDWFVFADWHSSYDEVCQLLQFEVTPDNALLVKVMTGNVSGYQCFEGSGTAFKTSEVFDRKVNKNTWNDFIVHVKWTAHATGVIEVFHKTEEQETFRKVLNLRNIPTLQYQSNRNNPAMPYFKLAHYRSKLNTHTSTLYHDGFRQGKTRQSITSGELYSLEPYRKD